MWFSAAAAERAELTSDRLLPLVSAGNFDGWFYVAHDIGAAVPLSEYRRISELSTARSLALLLGIAHALDDAVSQGKPPCEVTPDSVFLDPRLGAMVGDLGVAREALGNPAADNDAARRLGRPRGAARRGRPPALGGLLVRRDRLHAADGRPAARGRPPRRSRSARAPRLSDVRPDLPATLDTVFAVAMAPDPRKRYATAAEARHLLNLVMYGAPSMPALEASPRFRRGYGAAKPAAGPPGAAPPARRRGRTRAAAARSSGCSWPGRSPPAPSPGPSRPEATARRAAPRRRTAAGHERRAARRLAPATRSRRAGSRPSPAQRPEVRSADRSQSREPLSRADQAAPVLLGTTRPGATRPRPAATGARVTRYVIPTTSGKVEINCTSVARRG